MPGLLAVCQRRVPRLDNDITGREIAHEDFTCVSTLRLGRSRGSFCARSARARAGKSPSFICGHAGNGRGAAAAPERAPAPTIYPLQATFTQINASEYPNSDGTDLWPCFGFGSAGAPNLDCPTVGNPSVALPLGGVVLGVPQYVWKLANNTGYGYGNGDGNGNGCDALINGTSGPLPVNGTAGATQYKPCGQIATWYRMIPTTREMICCSES